MGFSEFLSPSNSIFPRLKIICGDSPKIYSLEPWIKILIEAFSPIMICSFRSCLWFWHAYLHWLLGVQLEEATVIEIMTVITTVGVMIIMTVMTTTTTRKIMEIEATAGITRQIRAQFEKFVDLPNIIDLINKDVKQSGIIEFIFNFIKNEKSAQNNHSLLRTHQCSCESRFSWTVFSKGGKDQWNSIEKLDEPCEYMLDGL